MKSTDRRIPNRSTWLPHHAIHVPRVLSAPTEVDSPFFGLTTRVVKKTLNMTAFFGISPKPIEIKGIFKSAYSRSVTA